MERLDDKGCAAKMKRFILVLLLISVMIAPAVIAQNETISPGASLATPDCNRNGIQDPGETCITCPPDVRCKSGEMCTDAGECVKQASFTIYIIVGAGVIVLLGLFFVAKRLTKKPEQPLPKPLLMQQRPAQPVMQPPQKPAQLPEKPAEEKPMQNPPVQMPPRLQQTPEQKPMQQKPEEQKEETEEKEETNETQIQRFIRQRRETGWTDEQIRQKMKETGWKDTQIALEFLRAPKFVKKQ